MPLSKEVFQHLRTIKMQKVIHYEASLSVSQYYELTSWFKNHAIFPKIDIETDIKQAQQLEKLRHRLSIICFTLEALLAKKMPLQLKALLYKAKEAVFYAAGHVSTNKRLTLKEIDSGLRYFTLSSDYLINLAANFLAIEKEHMKQGFAILDRIIQQIKAKLIKTKRIRSISA